jgi:GTPase SAR1 family protein
MIELLTAPIPIIILGAPNFDVVLCCKCLLTKHVIHNKNVSFFSELESLKQSLLFTELLDIGGSHSHRNCRHVFYNNFHGIILVHDLSNRKSQQNLEKWLAEVFQR